MKIEVYIDADYVGLIVDRRSTTRYCTFLVDNLITWRSKKQNVVTRSSAESEFRAMAQGICEILCIQIILKDLKIEWICPIKLYCDNKSVITIAHNLIQHDRTKHIEIDCHFIKKKLDNSFICIEYISPNNQITNFFTKRLNSKLFQSFICKLEMYNIHAPS